jgi:hypothetical protein
VLIVVLFTSFFPKQFERDEPVRKLAVLSRSIVPCDPPVSNLKFLELEEAMLNLLGEDSPVAHRPARRAHARLFSGLDMSGQMFIKTSLVKLTYVAGQLDESDFIRGPVYV